MTYTSAKDFLTLDKTMPKSDENGLSFGSFASTLNGLQTAQSAKDGASRATGLIQFGKGLYELISALLA